MGTSRMRAAPLGATHLEGAFVDVAEVAPIQGHDEELDKNLTLREFSVPKAQPPKAKVAPTRHHGATALHGAFEI